MIMLFKLIILLTFIQFAQMLESVTVPPKPCKDEGLKLNQTMNCDNFNDFVTCMSKNEDSAKMAEGLKKVCGNSELNLKDCADCAAYRGRATVGPTPPALLVAAGWALVTQRM